MSLTVAGSYCTTIRCLRASLFLSVVIVPISSAKAQVADDNAVTSAEDAFGTRVGRESIGIYGPGDVRGFSPSRAGNIRIEGVYFDQQGFLTSRLINQATIKVGPSAQGYAFPAPTGIVDYGLMDVTERPLASAFVLAGPFGGAGASLDFRTPLAGPKLGLAASAGYFRTESGNGSLDESVSGAVLLQARPTGSTNITAFYGATHSLGQTAQGIYIPEGSFLPLGIKRGRYPGPQWTSAPSVSSNAGLIARANYAGWSITAGAFKSLYHFSPFVTNLIIVDEQSQTIRLAIGSPTQRFGSASGELRLSRAFQDGPRTHLLLFSLRGREAKSRYGGDDTVFLGEAGLNQVIRTQRPSFNYSPTSLDTVEQLTPGLSYGLEWKDRGSITIGLQRSRYSKATVSQQETIADTTNVWLPSISGNIRVFKGALLYASYVRGLEEAGNAPGFAANANEVLPANATRQWDVGLVWSPHASTTLILGYFNLVKPYIALDDDNIYRRLGEQTNKGLEFSLKSTPLKGLTIVAGAALMRPKVTNGLSSASVLGDRPVGQGDLKAQINLEYQLPFAKDLSLTGNMSRNSSSAGTVDNAVIVPGIDTLNVGARYNFRLGRSQAQFRVEITNALNENGFYVLGSGAYAPIDQRGISAYIAADF